MGLIMTGIWYMMQAGMRYVRVTNASIAVQQACLTALGRITQELGESSRLGFSLSGSKDSAELVLASPRDEKGRLRYDSQNRLLWQKSVLFYIDRVNGVRCLMRKERLLSRPTAKPPDLPPAAVLRDDPTLPPQLVASHVSDFRAGYAHDEDTGVDSDNRITLEVAAEVETIERGGSTKDFTFKIESGVVLGN